MATGTDTPANRIETLRNRINTSDDIADADADALIQFADEMALLRSTYSDHRREKLLRHTTIMAEEVGGLAAALEDREAAEDLLRWIHDTYDNEETNRDYRVALRVFGRRVTGEDEPPESIEWIPSDTSDNYDTKPEPAQMLRWDTDVQEMLDATRNNRDAAAIALAFDAGPRGGEFEAITVGDISDSDYGLRLTLRGKQGKRTVTLIPSVPYVNRWLNDHPASDDSDAPLWSKLDEPESLSYRMITKMLREPGRRAGVDKPLTLTNFRKSSAAHLTSKGMNQAHLEDHHGWVRGSKVASRYVSVFSEDSERELARVYGKEVPDDDTDQIAPVTCPRCDKDTPREKDLCVWCGQALEPGAAELAERVDDALVEAIANAEDIEERRELLGLRSEVREDAEIRADAVDRLAALLDTD